MSRSIRATSWLAPPVGWCQPPRAASTITVRFTQRRCSARSAAQAEKRPRHARSTASKPSRTVGSDEKRPAVCDAPENRTAACHTDSCRAQLAPGAARAGAGPLSGADPITEENDGVARSSRKFTKDTQPSPESQPPEEGGPITRTHGEDPKGTDDSRKRIRVEYTFVQVRQQGTKRWTILHRPVVPAEGRPAPLKVCLGAHELGAGGAIYFEDITTKGLSGSGELEVLYDLEDAAEDDEAMIDETLEDHFGPGPVFDRDFIGTRCPRASRVSLIISTARSRRLLKRGRRSARTSFRRRPGFLRP